MKIPFYNCIIASLMLFFSGNVKAQDCSIPMAVITAKRKACGIKNEMRFSDGKTKCAIKKHPSNETWMLFC